MTYEEAIKHFKEDLRYAESHLEWEGQDPKYYEKWTVNRDALKLAIEALEYRAEVKKYGSELAMVIAHKHEAEARSKELDAKWEELKKEYSSLGGQE